MPHLRQVHISRNMAILLKEYRVMEYTDLTTIHRTIINCCECPRLVEWRQSVAIHKVRRFREDHYWGRPLPGFGDPHASIVVIGLAPAAHGGNRTGRMFTGDDSANWLMEALYQSGFANQNTSEHKEDGLILHNVYITAAVRCAPPQNKPTHEEAANCFHFLLNELDLIQPRVVVVLGRFAYDAIRHYLRLHGIKPHSSAHFAHGVQETWNLESRLLTVLISYHPSRQNTQTKKLTRPMFLQVFQAAHAILDMQ